jgi:hypothetical protein
LVVTGVVSQIRLCMCRGGEDGSNRGLWCAGGFVPLDNG